MAKNIFAITERCVACKACETACSIEKEVSKGSSRSFDENSSKRSRIQVKKVGGYNYPTNCNHCENASCMNACPTGAMRRDPETNSIYVVSDTCIGCWMCVMACPFGTVTTDYINKTAHKCDLCFERVKNGHNPACVDACPTKTLIFDTPEGFAAMKQKCTAKLVSGTT